MAPLASTGSFYVGYSAFHLLHRETGRAHLLNIPTLGLPVGLPLPKMGKKKVDLPSPSAGLPSYAPFETTVPMTFADFHGLYCRLTQAQIGLIFGYSIAYLTLWKSFYYRNQVAYVRGMNGWGVLLPGASVAHGVTILARGSGARAAEIDFPLILAPDDDDDELPEPLRLIKMEAREGPLIRLPGDLLFDFNSARIRDDVGPLLTLVGDMLNNRRTLPVVVEGHTDSVGTTAFNVDLAARRAKAVKRWLVAHGVYGASNFTVRAFGESQPIAPNRNPDGTDNPEGRLQNRRVAVRADWNVVR